MADDRVELIVRYIIENHDKYTRKRQYSSIFTVKSILALIKYYETFKKLNQEYNNPLKITGIYSFNANKNDKANNHEDFKSARDYLEK